MKLKNSLILVFLLIFTVIGFTQNSQNIKRSNIEETINGKQYYLHKVQKGETLFAISQAYHVKVEIIKNNNYGITDDIQPQQIIKIPVTTEPQVLEKRDENKAVNYHRVAPKETLYSLSTEYNVTIDEIKAANDGLPDGLKSGMFIKIPVTERGGEQVNNSTPQEKPKKDYFEYQSKGKESIYALAIRYRISIDTLYAINPGLEEDMSNEQIIKIPLNNEQIGFITHTVKKRETVNKLARKYDIGVEEIKGINPYISRHLEIGQVVRIPILKMDFGNGPPLDSLARMEYNPLHEAERQKSQKQLCHEMYDMGQYKVALLLPFYFSTLDTLANFKSEMGESSYEPSFIKPFVFIQFYEGFMMAVDSMKKAGLNVKIYVYNVEDNVEQAKQIIRNPEMLQMDLIVGPVFSSSFKVVANFAREHEINIVNPLSSREEVTLQNPYVFQPLPVNNDQFEVLTDFLNEEYNYAQIFIARHNPYKDALAFDQLKRTLDQKLETRKGDVTELYHEIIYTRDTTYTFVHTASTNQENVVVIYADNKVFMLDMLRKLNELRDTFNITVIGMPNWMEIEGLELEDMNNLNTHLFSRDFVSYNLPVVRNFVRDFRNRYATEPKEFAYSGYNIGVYFLSALMKFGPHFNDCIQYYDMELLNMAFHFEQIPGDGFRNKNWKILQIDDYELKDVSKRLKTYDLSQPPEKYYQYMEMGDDD